MGTISTVGIIGSGIMGSGLAEVAARAGFDVVVRSRTQAGADAVLHGIDAGLTKQVARERLTEDARHAILERITVTDDLHGLRDCDLVIESIVEDMEAKRELFEHLDRIVADDPHVAATGFTEPQQQVADPGAVYLDPEVVARRMSQCHRKQAFAIAKTDLQIDRALVAEYPPEVERTRLKVDAPLRPLCIECALLSRRQAPLAPHEAADGAVWFVGFLGHRE